MASDRGFSKPTPFALAVLGVIAVLSVIQSSAAQDADPPGRVARLDYAQGEVSVQPAGVGDWAAATINRPLTTGDKLWTDRSARAELDIGSIAVRANENTGFSFLNLDDTNTQIQLTAGTLAVHVRGRDPQEAIEVDTPNIAVSLLQAGDYRIQVNDAGDATVVSVHEGATDIDGGGANFKLHTQQTGTFTGAAQLSSNIGFLTLPDEFDRWSMDRDVQAEQPSQSAQYVSPDVVGYQDLDGNGEWDSEPEYGSVWVPTHVSEDWAPYSDGSWLWVAPWGWTWVDHSPWGFAPFHYGRWVSGRRGWCWVPGPRVARPVYAPALVAWVGGPHVSASIAVSGSPGVAWFPLGPREVYVPAYRVSPQYVTRVNVTNTRVSNTFVTNVYNNRAVVSYVNQRSPGAITAVSQDAFVSGQRVSQHGRPFDRERLSTARASTRDLTVVPVKQSVLGGAQRLNVPRPPAALHDRSVVTRGTPAPAAVPFDRTQPMIRANGGRPLAPADVNRLRPPERSSTNTGPVPPSAYAPLPNSRLGSPFNGNEHPAQRSEAPKYYQPVPMTQPAEESRRVPVNEAPAQPRPQLGFPPQESNFGAQPAPRREMRPEPPRQLQPQNEVRQAPAPAAESRRDTPREVHPERRDAPPRPEREVPHAVQQRPAGGREPR